MEENSPTSTFGFSARPSRTDTKISSLTIIAAAIFLFLTIIFIFLLYFYFKYYCASRSTRRRAHFIFGNPPIPIRGLDPAILSSIPITLYDPRDFKDGLECAVCLSELAAGEQARFLPKCSHGFHLECIDTWFQSHSNCPICRCDVAPEAVGDESPDLNSNVLFWGNRNGARAGRLASREENSSEIRAGSSERALVISIPGRADGLLSSSASPLASSRSVFEEMKSPLEGKRSPVTPKRWRLRRALIIGKRAFGSPSSSPKGGDIEEGLAGSGAENGEESSSKSPARSL